jgi:glycerophosphoryl diester phosphodiesterase
MPLISHRGTARLGLANSRESVELADQYNPAYIEVDINCTSDSKLIIYHGSASRFLHGKRTKESYAQLKAKYSYLMTLEEFLQIEVESPYIFDIKISDSESLTEIVRHLKKYARTDFAFTSHLENSLVALKKAFPRSIIFQSQPYHHGPITALEIARKHNFYGITLNKWWLTPLVYNLCKMHGKKVNAYTIDSALGIWLAQRAFPGSFITTNRPDTYRKIFPAKADIITE